MKKLLFLFATLFAFTACSSDNDAVDPNQLPVKGLELPVPAEGELPKAGTDLTIKGKGFNEASEIWFKTVVAVEATLSRAEEGAVKAEVKSVTDAEIVVVVPEVYGTQELFLGQGEKMFPLGKLEFAEKVAPKSVKHLEGQFGSNKDKYSFDFIYGESNRVEKMTIVYPFFNTRTLDVVIDYDESDRISRIAYKVVGSKTFMGDGRVTYPSKLTVAVDKKDVKKYTYTMNEAGQLVIVADGRNDKVDKFAYDEKGLILDYTEKDYGRDKTVYAFTQDDSNAILAGTNLPNWAWHFLMTDVLSGNAYMYSLFGAGNVASVGSKNYTYEYNDAKQPTSILVNGKVIGSVVYND